MLKTERTRQNPRKKLNEMENKHSTRQRIQENHENAHGTWDKKR